jgi:pyocin large subunit-like protein
MNTTTTIDTPTTKAPAKTATISLTAHGSTLTLHASRKADNTAETFVTTVDAAKKTEREMTETHPTFDAAKAAIATSAAKAEKMGWTKRAVGRGFVAKPDAFATLPAAPKTAPKAKK